MIGLERERARAKRRRRASVAIATASKSRRFQQFPENLEISISSDAIAWQSRTDSAPRQAGSIVPLRRRKGQPEKISRRFEPPAAPPRPIVMGSIGDPLRKRRLS
jgi:hypothetical protein